MISEEPELGAPLIEGLPYLAAEVRYAIEHEMAMTLEDVLSRRTRSLLFDRQASAVAAASVARMAAPLLGWDDARVHREIEAFRDLCDHEQTAALVAEEELHRS